VLNIVFRNKSGKYNACLAEKLTGVETTIKAFTQALKRFAGYAVGELSFYFHAAVFEVLPLKTRSAVLPPVCSGGPLMHAFSRFFEI